MKRWDYEKPYFNGDEFFAEVIRLVQSAHESIELETYIFSRDEFSRRVEVELINAAKRGVKVRILVDGIGAMGWIGRWHEELLSSGCRVHVYHPVRFSFIEAGRVFFRLNKRDHRKTIIIDKKYACVGSMNISCEHLREYRGALAWRDTGLIVQGHEISLLLETFERTWDKAQPYPPKHDWRRVFKLRKRLPSNSIVRLNDTRRLRKASSHDLRKRIRAAQKRVWITNPYFAPSPLFIAALIKAKEHGVDVKLLVPTVTDVFFMKWVAHSYYGSLLKTGISVFEYQPRFLHAKAVIIDDWATIGTSNLNTRSFRHDLEVDLVATHESTLQAMESQFHKDLSESRKIELHEWRKNRWVNRLGRLISFLFGKWI